MSAKKKPTPRRGDDNTTLTISLKRDLKERIEKAAKEDKRKVSPWVAIQLELALDALEASEGGKPVRKLNYWPRGVEPTARVAEEKNGTEE